MLDKQLNTIETHGFFFYLGLVRDFKGSLGGLVLGVILILFFLTGMFVNCLRRNKGIRCGSAS